MATEKTGKKKVGRVVSEFLAGDKKIKSLTREELAEIDEELEEGALAQDDGCNGTERTGRGIGAVAMITAADLEIKGPFVPVDVAAIYWLVYYRKKIPVA